MIYNDVEAYRSLDKTRHRFLIHLGVSNYVSATNTRSLVRAVLAGHSEASDLLVLEFSDVIQFSASNVLHATASDLSVIDVGHEGWENARFKVTDHGDGDLKVRCGKFGYEVIAASVAADGFLLR